MITHLYHANRDWNMVGFFLRQHVFWSNRDPVTGRRRWPILCPSTSSSCFSAKSSFCDFDCHDGKQRITYVHIEKNNHDGVDGKMPILCPSSCQWSSSYRAFFCHNVTGILWWLWFSLWHIIFKAQCPPVASLKNFPKNSTVLESKGFPKY